MRPNFRDVAAAMQGTHGGIAVSDHTSLLIGHQPLPISSIEGDDA
jgi:hypothetical protein